MTSGNRNSCSVSTNPASVDLARPDQCHYWDLDLIDTAASYSYKMNQKSASTEAALALGAQVDTDEKTVIW